MKTSTVVMLELKEIQDAILAAVREAVKPTSGSGCEVEFLIGDNQVHGARVTFTWGARPQNNIKG